MRRSRLCIVLLALLIAAIAVPAQPARAFKVDIHEALTAQALPFLNSAILEDINGEHLYQDTDHAFDSEHHVDNCEFREATDYINQQYTRPNGTFGDGGVLAELDPGEPQPFDATDEFGQLLHTSEDFYAHSNWVELGRADLVDSQLGLRVPLSPWTVVRDDIVVAEGEDLPAGWSASAAPKPKEPSITTNTGLPYRALISGTFGPSDECYDPIAVAHGSDDADALNKDNPSRPGFAVAHDLAVHQAAHEWCRMLNLLNNRYGYAGASIPMGLWVDPNGYPHPAGTPCAPQPRSGEHNVTVSLRHVNVRNDTDPAGSGEINLSLVLYTGDFRDSVRTHVGPLDISSGDDADGNVLSGMTQTLSCLADADTAVSTLQGWDDDAGTEGLFDDEDSDPDDVLVGVTTSSLGSEDGSRQATVQSGDLDATFDINTSMSPDTDADGLSTCREQQLGTNPSDPDTDHDGVSDGAEVTNYHTNPLQADPFLDLSITKSASPTTVAVGAKLVYTLDVANSGPHAGSQVTVSDLLPPGLTYLESTAGCSLAAPSTLTCALGELAVGASKQINITVLPNISSVPSAVSSIVLTNTVSVVDPSGVDLDVANNSATAGVRIVNSRVTKGLRALYSFQEGAGSVVHDISGFGTPLDLTIGDVTAIQWTPNSLRVITPTLLASAMPATKISEVISTTNELTFEAWVTSAMSQQNSLARIATLSNDAVRRNVELVYQQEHDHTRARYLVRLRTAETELDGKPPLQTPEISATAELQHVVYTHDALGLTRIYINGIERAHDLVDGNFSTWLDDYHLVLANVLTNDRPWLGAYQLFGVYNRALSPAEVNQNFQAGPSGGGDAPIPGVRALYTFDEGSGTTVHDTAGGSPPLDLNIQDTSNIQWVPGGLVVSATAMLLSNAPAVTIGRSISTTNELSLELWVRAGSPAQAAPGTIVAIATDSASRNVAVDQIVSDDSLRTRYESRLRTTTTSRGGKALRTRWQHFSPNITYLVYTRDALGIVRFYVNGVMQSQRTLSGTLLNWDASAHLVLANDVGGDHAWVGEYRLLAFHNRAISPNEVSQHFELGPNTIDIIP